MQIYLSNAGQEPIYAQITRQIKQQILSGALRPGDALPSIRLLAKELRISVITTKRAYEDLERDGFILTQQGRGQLCRRAKIPPCCAKNILKRSRTAVRRGAVDASRGWAVSATMRSQRLCAFCGRADLWQQNAAALRGITKQYKDFTPLGRLI